MKAGSSYTYLSQIKIPMVIKEDIKGYTQVNAQVHFIYTYIYTYTHTYIHRHSCKYATTHYGKTENHYNCIAISVPMYLIFAALVALVSVTYHVEFP